MSDLPAHIRGFSPLAPSPATKMLEKPAARRPQPRHVLEARELEAEHHEGLVGFGLPDDHRHTAGLQPSLPPLKRRPAIVDLYVVQHLKARPRWFPDPPALHARAVASLVHRDPRCRT